MPEYTLLNTLDSVQINIKLSDTLHKFLSVSDSYNIYHIKDFLCRCLHILLLLLPAFHYSDVHFYCYSAVCTNIIL